MAKSEMKQFGDFTSEDFNLAGSLSETVQSTSGYRIIQTELAVTSWSGEPMGNGCVGAGSGGQLCLWQREQM